MGSQERDISRIEVQLTVANWHLHDAMRATGDLAVHKLQCAKLAYAGILRSLSEAKLTTEERRQIERELRVLQSRLEGGPVLAREASAAAQDDTAANAE
ncbi:MAG TPA: hypothetical protein VJ738_10520 [Steroidobacteraceae bacterium]|nr:hypothetical protein [Steroidobacteraceae bacterium]